MWPGWILTRSVSPYFYNSYEFLCRTQRESQNLAVLWLVVNCHSIVLIRQQKLMANTLLGLFDVRCHWLLETLLIFIARALLTPAAAAFRRRLLFMSLAEFDSSSAQGSLLILNEAIPFIHFRAPFYHLSFTFWSKWLIMSEKIFITSENSAVSIPSASVVWRTQAPLFSGCLGQCGFIYLHHVLVEKYMWLCDCTTDMYKCMALAFRKWVYFKEKF